MSLDKWVNYNWLDLSRNYIGLKNNVWLPQEYTNGIIKKEK